MVWFFCFFCFFWGGAKSEGFAQDRLELDSEVRVEASPREILTRTASTRTCGTATLAKTLSSDELTVALQRSATPLQRSATRLQRY